MYMSSLVQVTANRELERGAAETESALAALRDRSRRGLLLLSQKRDALRGSNGALREAVGADRCRVEELDVVLGARVRSFVAPSLPPSLCSCVPPCSVVLPPPLLFPSSPPPS